jgi:nucleotide-binding universal stress UspA family protein
MRDPVDVGMNAPGLASTTFEAPDTAMRSAPRRTLLLATDLTPTSLVAETEAIGLARDLRGELLIVSVIDPRTLRGPRGDYVQRMDQARAELQARARGLQDRAATAGVGVRLLIWEGEPAESVLEAAAAESVSMIVIGSHGRRGMDRLVLGSVSDRVVREASVPVVVARARPTT